MRYYSSSKSLEISLGLSILLHLFLFVYIKSPKPFKKIEPSPISVEYISIPKKVGETKIKNGKIGASTVKEASVPDKSITVPEPVERPAEEVPQEAKVSPVPYPIEVPKTPSYPGIKDLTPSLDRLTNIGKEEGEGEEVGQDEETVSLESGDEKYTSYLNGVKVKIEGVWRYPEEARKSALQGRGLVSFTIERDGTVSDIKLIASSGYPILDEEIKKAIKAASPFNPMAENMRIKRLNVV
ncbi:MAG: energy transducer TonB, partial [Deltaproteobacteria bacterium]